VKKHRLDLAVLFVLASGACAYVSFAVPADRNVAIRVYVLVVGGLAMVAVLAAVGATLPRRRRPELSQALGERAIPPRPVTELARMERKVTLAVGNAYDLHRRLLPQLREIAQARLERSGKNAGPDTLGRWWELLRPDRPEPTDRFAPGISETDLRDLVTDLERM
jgi:uncharacterized membrane protein